MQPSTLLALPLVLGGSTAPAQDVRVPVAVQSVADQVAQLDALVADLVAVAQGSGADASAAWTGLQAAQQRIEAEQRRREQSEWQRHQAGASEQKAWVDAVSQLADPALRERALREIEAALAAGPVERQIAACGALAALSEVKFDKQPFREPVRALAQAGDGQLRVSALYALFNTVSAPEDLALVLPLADDPSPAARASGVHLLHLFSEGDLTGPAGAAALRILQEGGGRSALSGLWGARVSPELAEHVLDLSRSQDGEESHDAIYFGLSTFHDKSHPVVERLLEVAYDLDPNNNVRALWGLGTGVSEEDGPLVAERMRSLFAARSSMQLQAGALKLVGLYGSQGDVAWLQGIASDAARPEGVREVARAAAEAIARGRGRGGEERGAGAAKDAQGPPARPRRAQRAARSQRAPRPSPSPTPHTPHS